MYILKYYIRNLNNYIELIILLFVIFCNIKIDIVKVSGIEMELRRTPGYYT